MKFIAIALGLMATIAAALPNAEPRYKKLHHKKPITRTEPYTKLHHKKPITHKVYVGGVKDGQPILEYRPRWVHAQIGDYVRFEFLARNHTVTESTFDNPCEKKEGGFASGFRFNPDNLRGKEFFEVKVTDTNPHWVYCGQKLPTPHCQAGMVFAINPPRGEFAFRQFRKKAKHAPKPPKVHKVKVGGKPSPDAAPILRYDPQTVKAKVNDVVEFNFLANVHTVTQSSFENPCEPLAGGFKTGPQENMLDIKGKILKEFKITDDSKPLWFYCGTPTHCQKGMVFAINDGGKFHDFQKKAMKSQPKYN